MSNLKMRDALITAREVLVIEGYAEDNLAIVKIDEALAQQSAAVVELTDAEIFDAFTDGAGIFNKTIPLSEQEIKGFRSVIAAHIAKQSGGAV